MESLPHKGTTTQFPSPVNILLHLEEAPASKAQQQGCGGGGGQLPWHPDQAGTQAGRLTVSPCVRE